jgi:hypothetical protein
MTIQEAIQTDRPFRRPGGPWVTLIGEALMVPDAAGKWTRLQPSLADLRSTDWELKPPVPITFETRGSETIHCGTEIGDQIRNKKIRVRIQVIE